MEELIEKAKKGDKEAFICLVKLYEQNLYKIAKAKLYNEDDICDAMQETMISAYKGIKKLKNKIYFKTWLIKILINKCNDILTNNIIYKDKLQRCNITEDKSPFEKIENELDFQSILNILNEYDRIIVVLYYSNDFNLTEISKILDLNVNTVKTRLFRARNKIKDYYKGEW